MPRPSRPLPPSLLGPGGAPTQPPGRRTQEPGAAVFTRRAALEVGTTPSRLRAGDLRRVGYGLRTAAGAEADPVSRMRALTAQADRGAVVSHASAAWLWGMWLPSRLDPFDPVHLSIRRRDGARSRHAEAAGHQLPVQAATGTVAGVPVTSAAWTWTDLATQLVPGGDPRSVPPPVEERALEDLVVAGESLLQCAHGAAGRDQPGGHPRCTREELAAVVGMRRNVRGVRLLRAALPLLRDGSGSPAESRLRLRLVAAGFPEARMNVRLTLSDGSWIMPDLVWEDARVCLEYEGDHHRTDAEQFRRDISRVRRLEAADWTCLRAAGDVWRPEGFERLTQDLRSAFLRRRSPVPSWTSRQQWSSPGPRSSIF